MLAFHNDPAIKEKYLERLRQHRAADEIIQGTGWENGKGCAVGCTLHDYNHASYETELGIPRIIARLEDKIFEGLTNGTAKDFPIKFLEAIPVGKDLSLVWPKFMLWLLEDSEWGVIRFNKHKSILKVIEFFKRKIAGEEISIKEWQQARDDVYTARRAAAAYAAAAAAYAAAYAAADAADAAYADARKRQWVSMSNKLLSLLAE